MSITPGLPPRDYVVEEYTTTVCPHCFATRQRRSDEVEVFKDGMLVSHDGSVWLRRFCREHGETESLYEEDVKIWRARNGWSTPTLRVTPDRCDNYRAFPDGYRDGLPASHGQHSCILLLNITDRCNYGCTTCYASARAPGTPVSHDERPTIPEILHTVKTVIAREGGKLGVLMLSGGEPTVRDDLMEVIPRLLELPITRILLNTNGRRIARDDRFLDFLHRHRHKIEVYLQFDGVRPSTYRALRDEDVACEKIATLRRLNEAGVFTTLVATVQRGINEDEVGDIIRLGVETPRCAGLALQPMFGSGRAPAFDPRNRTTPTGILRRLGEQTAGLVDWTDFIPLPCSHKDCCDITYLIRTGDGTWKSLPKLIGKDELKRWIHLVSNTISFESVSVAAGEMLKSGALQRVFSEQLKVGTPALMGDIAWMCDCIPGLPELLGGIWSRVRGRNDMLEHAAERTFRITIKMFMDAHTFHEARLRQCCVHTGTFEDDPRRYSFCWRWLFADADDTPNPSIIPLEAVKV
ncbi:MAG: radical SAM protein [Armatimonadota bacterium]|nr:radical SAM protein [Armatimonadota bacterium]